jgi:O-methyltransferase
LIKSSASPTLSRGASSAPPKLSAHGTAVPSKVTDDLSAMRYHEAGMAARAKGDDEEAFKMFARAISLLPRYEPSRDELRLMSGECLAAITKDMSPSDKLPLLTRAIEMDPVNSAAREAHAQAYRDRRGGTDLTRMCFIFYDGDRARHIHEEAYKRAIESVTIGGVVGDVLEFGVLGGWSARILSEVMRDVFNLNNLHLFDSFEGLPEYASEIDRKSYEIGGRNIWSDKMKFPSEFLKQFGQEHQWHIRDRLSEVIRPERILVHKGFYSETLKNNLNIKASVVHVDCDLYQSAAEVLWGLHRMGALQDGTVMLFDDWNCNRGNPNYGERRAWREFLAGQTEISACAWFTYGYNGAAFILHDNRV